MRELKFRAWNTIVRRFQYFELEDLEKQKGKIQWHNLMISQYTGLKDVNGKMIFEGDIVKNIFIPKSAYEVKFQDGCFFVGDFALGITIDPDFHTLETMNSEDWVEVIGNIHENPKLLKKK